MTYKKKSRGSRAVSYYLGCIRHLHNQARMTYNDDEGGQVFIPRQPFLEKNIIPRQPMTDHRVLTVQQLRKIMEAKLTPGSRAEMARDVFVLSFALAGTNAIDIFKMQRSSLKGDKLTFNRSKTERARQDHARITLKVLPEAMTIIKRYAATDGALMLFRQKYSTAKGFCHACNLGMKDVAEVVGISDSLTTYYARHSWATIARNICKVDFDTVNAGLNHVHRGADRIGDVYIARDYSAIWEAQEKVMDVVFNAAKVEKVQISAAI
jgi:integrase